MSVKKKTQGLNPRQALLANKNCLEQGETPRRARLIWEGRWIERKKGRTRQRKAQNSFVCRVKHDFYKCSHLSISSVLLGKHGRAQPVLAEGRPCVCISVGVCL